jgi:mono/diheme cytochrome c family protein
MTIALTQGRKNRPTKHPRALWILAATLVGAGWLALGGASGVRAGGADDEAAKEKITKGRVVYLRYCVSCHGKEARGDGSLAKDLRVPVPDLTTLALRSGGVYPEERVVRIITKGNEVRGHGTEDMPAWGPAFNRTDGIETAVDEAIRSLAGYLGSVQRRK